MAIELRVVGDAALETPVLSIDGVAPAGPTLSHRPGNRTAEEWRADTAAAVVANWLDGRAVGAVHAAEGVEASDDPGGVLAAAGSGGVFLGEYGAGAAIAAFLWQREMEPGAERNLLLAAATAADYGCLNAPDAVRIALTLEGFGRRPPAELRRGLERAGGAGERGVMLFRHALEQLPGLLENPAAMPGYWEEALAATERWLEGLRAGEHQVLAVDDDLDLVHLLSRGPCDRRALRTLAPQSRSLVSEVRGEGWRHRFTYEVESFFDMESLEPPERHPLAEIAAELSRADAVEWGFDSDLQAPLVGLWSGGKAAAEATPSRLAPTAVREAIVAFLEKADGIDIDW